MNSQFWENIDVVRPLGGYIFLIDRVAINYNIRNKYY